MKKILITNKPKYIKVTEDIDFFELFQKIEQVSENCFFLESLGEENDRARFSIIGFSPESLVRNRNNDMSYSLLRKIMPDEVISREYSGGLVGYMGFDLFDEFEQSLSLVRHPAFDRFLFGVYTDGLVFDKISGELSYFYFKENRFNYVKKMLNQQTNNSTKTPTITSHGYTMTKSEHADKVKRVKRYIRDGLIFQCVLGFKTEYEIYGNTVEIYARLREINPSPHMYDIKFGGTKIIGASPELLFRMRDGLLETFPLAGTAKRGKNCEEDRQFARKLLSDPKEQAEHKMLVDLHRNDIGKVARINTVRVNKLMEIKKYSHVQHMSSEISGMLSSSEDIFSVLASSFPAGTLAGAPKIEAVRILQQMEMLPRGPYGGAVGYFGFNGSGTFAIPIRTLFISGTYGFTQAGSGIVADSVAENEYEEIINKLKPIEMVLQSFMN